jgi:hypothetical protein
VTHGVRLLLRSADRGDVAFGFSCKVLSTLLVAALLGLQNIDVVLACLEPTKELQVEVEELLRRRDHLEPTDHVDQDRALRAVDGIGQDPTLVVNVRRPGEERACHSTEP